uniref:Uncharacterized protein n=1 Tax=Arundo donax TaxID=35708 RepID=A0A0A9ANQ1_ARUDO
MPARTQDDSQDFNMNAANMLERSDLVSDLSPSCQWLKTTLTFAIT